MKWQNTALLLALASMIMTSACIRDNCEATQHFVQYEPVILPAAELRHISWEETRELRNPGKIYTYGNLLLINEQHEGLHFIDNSDPDNPAKVGFLSIPGNVDMAIRGDFLYADNGPDLITIDLTQVQTAKVTSRVEEVFLSQVPRTQNGYILYYEPTNRVQEVPCSNGPNGGWFWQEDILMIDRASADGVFVANSGGVPQAVGTGGSLARFTILDKHLYTVDQNSLHVFGLQSPQSPIEENLVSIGWGIETIFPLGDNLFVGANNGMYIFDASDRNAPVQLSVFQHARACDPVFVQGDIAYVTLRDGTICESFSNQLDVVDISDLTNPQLLRTFPMHHPIGLSVFSDRLFLCEDDQGLKVYDVEDWRNIERGTVEQLTGFTAVDIITMPTRKLALVVGDHGLYQFDLTNPDQPRQLSVIPVVKP